MDYTQQFLPRPNNHRSLAIEGSSRTLEFGHHDAGHSNFNNERMRFLSILRRHRLPILTIFGTFILGSILWTLIAPKSYRAQTTLEVMGINQEFMNNKDVDPNTSMSGMDSYLETQTKLMLSAGVINHTAQAAASAVPPSVLEHQSLPGKLLSFVGLGGEKRSAEDVIRKMLGHAKVKAIGQASLVSVTVDGPDPKLAATVANTLTEQYQSLTQDSRYNAAANTGAFLSRQLDSFQKKLQDSENALQSYARVAGLVYNDDSRESAAHERLREIQADLGRAETDRAAKQSQLELLKNSPVDALPKVLDDGGLREDKSRLAGLKQQLADLLTTYKPEHYRVRHVQAQIDELQAQIKVERGSVVNRMQNDFEAARRQQQLLMDAYNRQSGVVQDQSGKQVRYNMLKQEVDANRQTYQSMLQRVKEANVIQALRSSNIRVVDAAEPSGRPYSPNLGTNLGLGILGAIVISVLYTLLRERSDRSLRLPGESVRLLDIPELGVIPSAKIDSRTPIFLPERGHLQITDGTVAGENKVVKSRREIARWEKNGSLVAESFRSAVTSILMYGRNGALHRSILITSAHPQAGKTTAVSNLGIALAEIGRRVLIIDGDMRRPRLGGMFGFDDAKGLADVLNEETDLNQGKSFIRQTLFQNLFILPSGKAGANIPRLLHSERMSEFMDLVRDEYDFVLIDSPPMMAIADARLLCRSADGVILICRAGHTSTEQLVLSHRRLAQDGSRVIGTILNDWDPRAEDPSYLTAYSDYLRTDRA